ncbi:MAG: winged helix-turn-helix domain-containing protein [Bryobacteraceae bacterium]
MMPAQGEEPSICYRFGEHTLYPDGRGLFRNGEFIRLSRKPYEVLLYLVAHAPRAVSREELLREVWKGARDLNVVEQCVHDLRARLGDHPKKPAFIQTVYGTGYRFVADVDVVPLTVEEREAVPAEPTVEASLRAVPAGLTRRRVWLAVAGVGLPAMALLFWQRRGTGSAMPVQAVRIFPAGRELHALDGAGRVLWRYPLPFPAATLTLDEMKKRVWHLGPEAGARTERILVAVPRADGTAGALAHALFCLSSSGSLLWQYVPETKLEFPARKFDGGWEIQKVLPAEDAIWVAVKHEIWWPSFVARIEKGRSRVVLVHSGLLRDLALKPAAGGPVVAAAGVNNEYGLAALAVLRPPYEPAVSPESERSPYRCLNGPARVIEPYVLFPRTDLAVAAGKPYAIATAARWHGSQLEIEVEEVEDYSSFYRFEESLRPLSFAVSDGYAQAHDAYFRRGAIDHPAKQCSGLLASRTLRIYGNGRWHEAIVSHAADSAPLAKPTP